ncbi:MULTISPECIES: SH3-like domain-containing protein [unclassified Acidiphilium]|jgi:nitrile hydratase|uniref:SH3-like domain-containing protein n=1 Tax=unclassified Acidiphilium TaxID=2617493 RepID=UPI000BD8C87E|nr:SH3-like domain-containing protein [Acidiphilium sp.]OYV56258.1 MAG: hypothetical protein B7Z76_06495 [Acidiphilium sp. 20-67-58]
MTAFAPGDNVLVRDDWPETGGAVHIRTPHYVRGMQGEIRAYLGRFPNPEDLAFARPAPELELYHVAFPLQAIWPEGRGDDEILIEIYETWLARP